MEVAEQPTVPCRFCGEAILAAAKKCRFCGEWLDEAARATGRARGEAPVDVPVALKVWGALVMAFCGLLGGLQAAQSLYFLLAIAPRFGGGSAVGISVSTAFSVLIWLVLGRMGWGLWRGKRTAVIGMAIFGVLMAGIAVPLLASRDPTPGLIVLGFALVGFAPPVAAGVLSWRRLT